MRPPLVLLGLVLVGCSESTPPTPPPTSLEVFGSYAAIPIAPDDALTIPLRLTPAGSLVGRTLVGGESRVFVWTEGGGMTLRPPLPAEFKATAAADDESVGRARRAATPA